MTETFISIKNWQKMPLTMVLKWLIQLINSSAARKSGKFVEWETVVQFFIAESVILF